MSGGAVPELTVSLLAAAARHYFAVAGVPGSLVGPTVYTYTDYYITTTTTTVRVIRGSITTTTANCVSATRENTVLCQYHVMGWNLLHYIRQGWKVCFICLSVSRVTKKVGEF